MADIAAEVKARSTAEAVLRVADIVAGVNAAVVNIVAVDAAVVNTVAVDAATVNIVAVAVAENTAAAKAVAVAENTAADLPAIQVMAVTRTAGARRALSDRRHSDCALRPKEALGWSFAS